MTNIDLLTFLCQKHKVPRPFVKFVDQPHWVEGGCGGYYVPRVHILCLVKSTGEDPEIVLAHEFHHYVDDLKHGIIQKGVNEASVQARAVRDVVEFRGG